MDPLSVTASIISILQLTTSALGYVATIKEARDDRVNLAIELSNLNTLLIQLQHRVEGSHTEDSWFTAIKTLAVVDGPLDQLRVDLEKLQLLTETTHGIQELGRKLTWKFDKRKAETLLLRIERLKSLIELALNNDLFGLCMAIKSDLADAKVDVSEILRVLQKVQEDQKGAILAARSRDHTTIADWFSPLEFWSKQQLYFATRHPGTCQWLLDTQEYKDWIDGKHRLMLLTGIPGAGKSILSSLVVDHVQNRYTESDVAVTWIYCSYKESSNQTAYSLIASLLKQVLYQRQELSQEVKKVYDFQPRSLPTLEKVVELLRSEFENFSKVFVIIDALDEMANEQASLGTFTATLKTLPDNAFLLVTTRHIPAIETDFSEAKRIEISATDQDVASYVASRIASERLLAKHVSADPGLQAEIMTRIVKNVQGMFLLAKLHMDSIAWKPTRKAVRKALDVLPSGLDATYSEAMQRIRSQPLEIVAIAEKVLCWVAFSFRTLSVAELQHAVAIEPGARELDEDELPDDSILISSCAGLVIEEKAGKNRKVRLAHETTQAYFDRNHETELPSARRGISLRCIAYLCLDLFSKNLEKEVYDSIYPRLALTPYAAKYWGRHADDMKSDETASKAVAEFMAIPCRVAWANEFFHHIWSRCSEGILEVHRKRFSGIKGLHLATILNLSFAIELLLQRGEAINSVDFLGRTPLLYAAEFANEDTVRFLLNIPGIDVNCRDNEGLGVLSTAAKARRPEIIAFLLDNSENFGIDVDSRDKDGRNALIWAAMSRRGECVEKFALRSDVDFNLKDIQGHTAISTAVFVGAYQVVKQLLAISKVDLMSRYNEARYEEQGMSNMTLLHLALGRPLYFKLTEGHISTLKLLLATKTIGVNERDAWGATALHRSTNRWLTGALDALLEQEDIDVNAADAEGKTPLHWAASHNNDEALSRLLQHKSINVNAQTKEGKAALHIAAAGEENSQILRLLLECEGIDVNLRDSQVQTPLTIFLNRDLSGTEDENEDLDLLLAKGCVL